MKYCHFCIAESTHAALQARGKAEAAPKEQAANLSQPLRAEPRQSSRKAVKGQSKILFS